MPKLLALAVAAALSGVAATSVDAAGLGRLTVQSGLGQPLSAEVEITSVGREEAGSLSARLAPAEAFRQAGLEYNPALTGLRFAIERRPNGSAVLRITSSQAINEPFVDLLVELNWAAGKFVREYTFLLDPPELRIGQAAGSTAAASITAPALGSQAAPAARVAAAPASPPAPSAAPVRSPAAAPAARSAAPSRPAPTAAAPRADQPASAGSGSPSGEVPDRVVVRQGDTLARIAGRVKPADIALEQAVVAIYATNPNAFFGSVHQLLAGATLQIPDRAAMAAVDAEAAKREIRAQAADFNAYRARLAAQAREVESASAGRSATGSVGAHVDDKAAPIASGDQLKLSRPEASGSGADAAGAAGSASGRAAVNAEAQVAREAALREQQERVQALERNVADLQRLVELKNRQLAELQRQVETARAAGTTALGAVGSVTAPAASAAAVPAAAESAVSAPAASGDAPVAVPATATTGSPAVPASSGSSSPASASETAPSPTAAEASATSGASSTPAAPATPATTPTFETPAASASPAPTGDSTPAPSASAQAPATTAAEPGVLESLFENPLLLPAFAAIALGIGAYGLYAVRRRKKPDEFEDSLSAADAFTANSLFGSTGGQAVDTNNSLFATSTRDSGVDVHSTEVDPIAEAEVYIAYGRESQAEEILKEALKRQPERQAIRLKLLEIHAARKDPIAFGAVAQEMYDLAGGQNEEWPKAVTLGLSIDPANPLYTGLGDSAQDERPDDAAGRAATGIAGTVPGSASAAELSAAAGAAAAMFGERLDGNAAEAPRVPLGGSFAETVPMDGESVDGAEVPALDFHLDLDSAAARGDGQTEAPADAASNDLSDLERAIAGRFELPSLDLDIEPLEGARAEASASAQQPGAEEPLALADLGEFKIDLPSLEGLDTQPAVLEDDDERPAVDLSDFDIGNDGRLDLATGDLGLASADTAIASSADSSRWQEMATKLDLASAYEEIGDKEGARELLEEVLEGGDIAQQQKARAMLTKIS